MYIPKTLRKKLARAFTALGLILAAPLASQAQDLSKDLVAYWPLDEVQGSKTPDRVNGYDMDLNNLTAADLVPGKVGKAFKFSNANKTLLSRVHKAGEQLPINQHPAFTVSLWAKVNGTGQTDLRLFSEGNTGNSNPLFNLGTHNTDGTLDLFLRQTGWTDVNHITTVGEPLNDQWHHIVFTQQADGARKIYLDGVADDLEIPAKAAGAWLLNDTTIGGILRASPGFWVTGLIDEVALWKRALTGAEIKTVTADGLKSVFSPLADGLVSHWPLDEVQGTKTPDVVSGYDMDLNNLSAADLVDGKIGKAFQFSNANKTLLSRVHKAGEQLPINQHPAFTISLWSKVKGSGQADLRLFSEANTGNSDPLFNLGTHNTDGTLDVFFRQSGWTDVNHITTTGEPLDDTWRHILFTQQEDGARKIYIDGVADDLDIPAKAAGAWRLNDTTIGGILRASPGFWVTGLLDDVALWKRALSDAEIAEVNKSGVPKVITRKLPLEIRAFTADYASVVQGDKVLLRWQATADANLAITPGPGDVTAATTFGAGSIEVPVTQSTTFTLTASRSGESVSSTVSILAVPAVAANWRLIENFNSYPAGGIGGKGNWSNPEGTFTVVDYGANKVLGFNDGNALTALPLNSLALREGAKATLFFRLKVSPEDTTSIYAISFGLTERPIRFNGDFNGNVGPYLRLERAAEGATVDLLAHNGVGAAYDSAADAVQPGKVYRVWIDIDNRPFNVVDGAQNGGDVYSLHIQAEGAATRTTLFQDYVADRDAVTIDPVFGAPGATLTHLFLSAMGAAQGNTNILFDDFYLSASGFNTTTPVAASPFEKVNGPTEIRIAGYAVDLTKGAFTLTWGSLSGVVYNVQRKSSIADAWSTIATGYPTGGATGATTSFTDTTGPTSAAFYRVTFSN